MKKSSVTSEQPPRRTRPALTPEARENQLVSRAMDLAEQQILNGTASSQIITHYLKMGTMKERLEREKLEKENALLKAKTDAIQSAQSMESLYKDAINAMKMYSGNGRYDEDEEEEEDTDND
jgi:hypothetical protein